jgi:hypothetical protein
MTRKPLLYTVLVAGCLPGLPDGTLPPTSTMPEALFDQTVAPLMSRCSGCHVGNEDSTSTTNYFLGPPPGSTASYYAGITNDRAVNGDFNPSSALLVNQGSHEGVTWWSTTEASTISSWLLAEAAARGPGSGSSTGSGSGLGDPLTVEAQWATCLGQSQSAYQSTYAYAIADMVTDGDQQCSSCHEPGGPGGAYWGTDDNYLAMFQKWQQQVYLLGPYLPSIVNNQYVMLTARSKICDKGQELANGDGTHPAFECTQTVTEQGQQVQPLDALDALGSAIQGIIDDGSCQGPYVFAPPTD